MTRTISVHFDGHVLVPDQPLNLPIGQALLVRVETPNAANDRFSDLRALATDLPDAPSDLAAEHDRYLYGGPPQ